MKKAFYNGRIFTGHEVLHRGAVLTEGNTITAIVPESDIPAGFEKKDLQGYNLSPSFIDLQIYGGNGQIFAYHLSTESIARTYDYCRSGGCTHFMITIATNTMEVMMKGIETVKEYWQQGGQGLLGLHLEGPYINPEKRGAHIKEYIKTPALDDIEKLLAAGKGVIKIMTLAPEQCDPRLVKLLLDNDILVSAGHSNASYKQATGGFAMGIPLATHLFNAMSPLQGREPGMVGAVYDQEKVMCSIVADGVHVDYASVRISKKIMGNRLFLITDAVTELKEGPYQYLFKGDRYVLPDGTLSGSALTMMAAVKNCVVNAGIDLAEALRMATAYPARAVKGEDRMGYIKAGYPASFAVFDDELSLKELL